MLGGLVKLEASDQTPGFFWFKDFTEGRRGMHVEVVQDDHLILQNTKKRAQLWKQVDFDTE